MGICGSAPDESFKEGAERTKKIEQFNKKTWNAEQQKIKLLLLGAGESGKSTIFKQMKIIYGNPFPVEERSQLVSVVHSNIISNARLLVGACEKIVALEDPSIAKDLAQVPDSEDTLLDKNVAAILKRLWEDKGAQETWARRAEYHIQDALSW